MNERDFHRRIKQHLNMSSQIIPATASARLHEARQKALSRQKLEVKGLSLAGLGRMISDSGLSSFKRNLAMLLVVLVALGSGLLGEWQRVADMEEVDSALLADDLPIDAYLDRGFDTWLHSDSPN